MIDVNKFFELESDESVLVYSSEGFANNCGQGDSHAIANIYNDIEKRELISKFEEEVMRELKGSKYSIEDIYRKEIWLNVLTYNDNGESKTITDEDEDAYSAVYDNIDSDDIEDTYSVYVKVKRGKNSLEFYWNASTPYQSVSQALTFKKVKTSDVRFCVVIERPVSSRDCGQFMLAGPFLSVEEATKVLPEMKSEIDYYQEKREPYVLATYVDDEWLRHQMKKK